MHFVKLKYLLTLDALVDALCDALVLLTRYHLLRHFVKLRYFAILTH